MICVRGFPGGSVVRICLPMQRTQVLSLGQEDPLEKEMATHSSILAWEIPWMEELGGLQSILTKLKAMNIGVVYLAVENSHCNH